MNDDLPIASRRILEAGNPPSANVLRQLRELQRIVDALSEVIQKNAIGPWLDQPNDVFDGLKPIEVMERGEVDRIWQMNSFCVRECWSELRSSSLALR